MITNGSTKKTKNQSGIIQNLSNGVLNSAEISVLEKGLNFCLTTKTPKTEQLMDDLYFFCRKLRKNISTIPQTIWL